MNLFMKLVLQGYIFIGQICRPLEGINESTTVTCYDWLPAEQHSIPLVLCSHVSVPTTGFELCSSHDSCHTVPSYFAYDPHTLQHTVQLLLHYIVLRKNGFLFLFISPAAVIPLPLYLRRKLAYLHDGFCAPFC